MRTIQMTLVLIATLLASAFVVSAQNGESQGQLFLVHEDVVKPSMVGQYEKAVKGFISNLSEHGITDMTFVAAMTNDLHYLYVSEIENMAELDKNPEEKMAAKMGKEAFQAVIDAFDGCYDYHKVFVARRADDLSYWPESNKASAAENKYRRWSFYHIQPGQEQEIEAIAKEWVELFKEKNIPTGYNLYVGGLGTEMPLYVVVESAKDAADFQAQSAKINELLGDSAKDLNARTMALVRKMEFKDGWIRPDLSYTPEAGEMTAK